MQLSRELALLQGQNQNEHLALPLLRLAAAVQTVMTWQQKASFPLYGIHELTVLRSSFTTLHSLALGMSLTSMACCFCAAKTFCRGDLCTCSFCTADSGVEAMQKDACSFSDIHKES